MKKIVLIMLTVLFACLTFACSASGIDENMSETRFNFFDGSCDNYYATLSSGYREDPYLADGVHNACKSFALIEVELFDTKFTGGFIDFSISIDSKQETHKLERNPFTNSYMFDLEKAVLDNSVIEIKIETLTDKTVLLENKSKYWEINYKEALDISSKKIMQKLKEKNSRFNGECYLKIVNNYTNKDNRYYWYFCYKNITLQTMSLIIDVNTGEILAINA